MSFAAGVRASSDYGSGFRVSFAIPKIPCLLILPLGQPFSLLAFLSSRHFDPMGWQSARYFVSGALAPVKGRPTLGPLDRLKAHALPQTHPPI